MRLTSDSEYEAALRDFAKLEGRTLSSEDAARKKELEGAIAAYSAERGRPAERKGRPPAKE